MGRPDQVAHSPTRRIEGLARRANRQGTLIQLRGQSRNAGEWNIIETVVDFVGEDDQVVLDGQSANAFELLAREYLAHRVVAATLDTAHHRTILKWKDRCLR